MNIIKCIPKVILDQNKYNGLRYTDKYITDGRFLLPRSFLKESFKYCNPNNSQQLTNEQLEKIYPREDARLFSYVKTNWLWDSGNGMFQRKFISNDHFSEEARETWIYEEFVKLLDIEILKAESNLSVCVIEGYNALVMPMREPNWKPK